MRRPRRRRRPERFDPGRLQVGRATERALGQLPGIDQELKHGVKIQAQWSLIAGEALSRMTTFLALKRGEVILGVTDQIVGQEVEMLGPTLVKKLNAILKKPVARRVRCRVIRPEILPRIPETPPGPPLDQPVPETTRARLETILEGLEDPELRERLRALFVKSIKRHGA